MVFKVMRWRSIEGEILGLRLEAGTKLCKKKKLEKYDEMVHNRISDACNQDNKNAVHTVSSSFLAFTILSQDILNHCLD